MRKHWIRLSSKTRPRHPMKEQQPNASFMGALKSIHSAASANSMAPEDLEKQRKGQELLGRLFSPMLGLSWKPFDLQGIPAAWVIPDGRHNPHSIILYCHGGGYTSGNLGYSRVLASKLAHMTGQSVLAFAYRLAPEFTYPAPQEDALKVWDYLMHLGYGARDITLLGDSAGGNLALELVLTLKETQRQLPGHLVLLSPWTDLTASGESYERCKDTDPILTQNYIHALRQVYAPGEDWSSPHLSPLFADLTGFPPTLIQVGELEILYDDSIQLRNALVRSGVPCRLHTFPDLWHVFQMFPIKKAAEAMEEIAEFLWTY